MKFEDYFKEAVAYGESLGLKNATDSDLAVELVSPKPIKRDDGTHFYPSFLTAWEYHGIDIDSLDIFNPEFTVEQQLKLIKLFISAYEKYLADKKEPVAADSAE